MKGASVLHPNTHANCIRDVELCALLRAIQYIVHRLSVHHNNRSFHESLAYSFEIDELDVTKIVFNTRCNTNISKLIGVLPKSQRFLLERHYVQLGCS